ncbi:MAG: carboxymuconolactone decarboxylase family protein [Pseudonocardia sp.]|nr:carboxymuconolactone decarboxylase family protein [Pseudonocardia sp.]
MSRIPGRRPDELDPAERAVYEAITGGPRATGPQLFPITDDDGALRGPFGAMLLQPALGDALQQLGAAIRYRGVLTDRCRELVILQVAAHWASGFEQRSHELLAARAGFGEDELRMLAAGGIPALDDPGEVAVARAAALLLAGGRLTDDEFAALRTELTGAELFEISTVVGYYGTLALQMRLFSVD